MITELFNIIAPVFICAAVGFIWAKSGRTFDAELVTTLVTNIGAPMLVFHTLTHVELEPAAVGTMAGAAVSALAVFGIVGAAVLKVLGLSLRCFLNSLMFANTGNMGLPLCLLTFGEPGLALAIAFFAVYAVLHFTVGVAIASGTASLSGLARIPILYAVAAALVFMVLGMKPPGWLANTTQILGSITIPLMLITLGISLAKLHVSSLGRSVGLSALRLGIGFGGGVAVAWVFGLEGTERGVLIIQSAMPVAVFNYLFAQRYGNAPEEVAGIVVISTVLSFVTLPALLWYVM